MAERRFCDICDSILTHDAFLHSTMKVNLDLRDNFRVKNEKEYSIYINHEYEKIRDSQTIKEVCPECNKLWTMLGELRKIQIKQLSEEVEKRLKAVDPEDNLTDTELEILIEQFKINKQNKE